MDNEPWHISWDHSGSFSDSVSYLGRDAKVTADLIKKMNKLLKEVEIPLAKDPNWRMKDELGRTLVIINDRYSYAWEGEGPILVGDRVMLPGEHGAWYGEVTDLGSAYQGHMRAITRKADPKN